MARDPLKSSHGTLAGEWRYILGIAVFHGLIYEHFNPQWVRIYHKITFKGRLLRGYTPNEYDHPPMQISPTWFGNILTPYWRPREM